MLKNSLKITLKAIPSPFKVVMRLFIIRPLRFYIRYAPWSAGKLLLYNALGAHIWWLETEVEAMTCFGKTLKVDASDIVGKYIYYFGIWEPGLTRYLQRSLNSGDIVIDVGANVGYFSLLASTLVGSMGRVVSVEALPEIFENLEYNVKRNNLNNIRLVNAAAWDKLERIRIFTQLDHPQGNTTVMSNWAIKYDLQDALEIQAKPLSAILTKEELENARLIKIDVEGAEWNVINEMREWLDKTSENLEIVIEISRSMLLAQNKSLKDILEVFKEFGFNGYRIENDYLTSKYVKNTSNNCLPQIKSWPDYSVDQIDIVFLRENFK